MQASIVALNADPIARLQGLRCSRLLAVLAAALLTACAGSGGGSLESTAFPYIISDNNIGVESHPRVIVAHVNFGRPSRKYLSDYEERVDGFVRERLEQEGFELVSSALFEDSWKNAVRRFGNPYNPTTGKVNEVAFGRVVRFVFESLKERDAVDAVLFTDLIERQISYGSSINRNARWDGVSRKLATQGPGSGVPTDFNWAQSTDAVSLWVNLFDLDARALFQGAGGIEVTKALSLKGTPKFIRRRSVLSNRRHIEEGVELALHPVIQMQGYPGEERPPSSAAAPAEAKAEAAEETVESETEPETEPDTETDSE